MSTSTRSSIKGYQLLDLIGEGAYGAFYCARQEYIDRQAAVKIIILEYANRSNSTRSREIRFVHTTFR